MAYAVYTTSTGKVDSAYRTLAEATAATIGSTDVSITSDVTLPTDLTFDGLWVWDTTNAKFRTVEPDDESDVDQIKTAAAVAVDNIDSWHVEIDKIGRHFKRSSVDLAHNLMTYVERGLRGVLLSSHWSSDRLSYAKGWTSAPTETNVTTMFKTLESSTVTDPTTRTDSRVVLIDTSFNSVALTGWVTNTDTNFLSNMASEATDLADYVNHAWIEDIT